jgi:anti-sigma factor RsiW
MVTMATEDPFNDRLSDYLDGEDLSPTERAEIEAHLATCARCETTLAELAAVAARAQSLPDQAPVADLWAGVSQRLTPAPAVLPFTRPAHRRFSFTLPQLVAAGLALMLLSGGLVWVARLGDPRASLPSAVAQMPPDEAAPAGPATEDAEPASALSRVAFADPNYDQAVSDLEKVLDTNRSRLDPETVRILEANLQTIDQAIEQSRKALRADPGNLYLNNHFAASRNRKIALLRRASALAMTQDSAGGS